MATNWNIIPSSSPAIFSTFPPTCRTCLTIQVKLRKAIALISRTDANEQESVVLLPELDGLHT
jgi:uncharacterized RmlC-like cupin family protein